MQADGTHDRRSTRIEPSDKALHVAGLGRIPLGRGRKNLRVSINIDRDPLATGSECIDDLVAGQGVEPGSQGCILAPGVALQVNGQQNLLQDILAMARIQMTSTRGDDPAQNRRNSIQKAGIGRLVATICGPHE